MAAGSTYTPIATQTLGTAASSVTFSSISGSYTDLRLVISGTASITGYAFTFGVNGDTGSNYSTTGISGNGTNAQSYRYANISNVSTYLGGWVNGYDSGSPSTITLDLQNYSNSTTNKTILWRSATGNRNTEAGVILWRNTAAITSCTVYAQSGANIVSGSTFTIYGIAAA